MVKAVIVIYNHRRDDYAEISARIKQVIEKKGLGKVLKEWEEYDTVMPFMGRVFKVRKLKVETNDPRRLKKELIPLEYDGDGKRVADIDVHVGLFEKKISWRDIAGKEKFSNKREFAMRLKA